MPAANITYLTKIYFAPGVAAETWTIAAQLEIRRPLVVTDPGIRAAGLLDLLYLPAATIFDTVPENPTESSALAALEQFRANQCDGVIAIGGGSPIDCAKAVALLATHAPPLRQYALIEGGLQKVTANKPPVIAIPTTAGTGSEVGRGALITFDLTTHAGLGAESDDPDSSPNQDHTAPHDKLALISPHLIPTAAVCDPRLTLGLPPALTAGTGMDAISHCVETFLSPRFNPVAEAIALDGLARALRNICRAVSQGDDLTARTEMLIAALHGGLTFQKGLGVIHALSHPLGGLTGKRLHHGTLNAVFLPHALRFNHDASPHKIHTLAQIAGVSSARNLPYFFESLTAAIGLPTRLRDMGVTQQDLEACVPGAVKDHCNQTNPRTPTESDLRNLYQAAW
jgi:alcohol dehydrogenase class IV